LLKNLSLLEIRITAIFINDFFSYEYYFACLSPINAKTAEPIGSKLENLPALWPVKLENIPTLWPVKLENLPALWPVKT